MGTYTEGHPAVAGLSEPPHQPARHFQVPTGDPVPRPGFAKALARDTMEKLPLEPAAEDGGLDRPEDDAGHAPGVQLPGERAKIPELSEIDNLTGVPQFPQAFPGRPDRQFIIPIIWSTIIGQVHKRNWSAVNGGELPPCTGGKHGGGGHPLVAELCGGLLDSCPGVRAYGPCAGQGPGSGCQANARRRGHIFESDRPRSHQATLEAFPFPVNCPVPALAAHCGMLQESPRAFAFFEFPGDLSIEKLAKYCGCGIDAYIIANSRHTKSIAGMDAIPYLGKWQAAPGNSLAGV